MPDTRHLSNAPITEAIISIRVKPHDDLNDDVIKAFIKSLKNTYPDCEEGREYRSQLKLEEGEAFWDTEKNPEKLYRLTNEDGKQVIQIRRDRIIFSRLRPYADWSNFLSEGMTIWDSYRSECSPQSVKRLAVRYINNIPLPITPRFKDTFTLTEIDNFLNAGPKGIQGVPNILKSYLNKVVMFNPNIPAYANVVQVVQESHEDGGFGYIFDIDAYNRCDYDLGNKELAITRELMVHTLTELRKYKNDIFFNSLSENTLRMFE